MTRPRYIAGVFAQVLLFPIQCLIFAVLVWVIAPLILLRATSGWLYRWCRALCLTRGDMDEAFDRLRAYWRERDELILFTRRGRSDTSIERLASRRFVARFPGCRDRLLSALEDPQPMVAAQALLAYDDLCRRYRDQTPPEACPGDICFRRDSLPEGLYERAELLRLREHEEGGGLVRLGALARRITGGGAGEFGPGAAAAY